MSSVSTSKVASLSNVPWLSLLTAALNATSNLLLLVSSQPEAAVKIALILSEQSKQMD
jgi:hypothetical protein